jgi:uncharacterized protein (DUF488 family)
MKILTIGFTKSSARSFFTRLQQANVRRVIDVRLNNVSQLAGFAKREDLQYFLSAIANIAYTHETQLAPTQEMLDTYKKQHGSWDEYEQRFLALITGRAVEARLDRAMFADGCLLCSEDKPHHCHRRIVAEYLKAKWGDVEVIHL